MQQCGTDAAHWNAGGRCQIATDRDDQVEEQLATFGPQRTTQLESALMTAFRQLLGRFWSWVRKTDVVTPDERQAGLRSVRDDPTGASFQDEAGRHRGMGI